MYKQNAFHISTNLLNMLVSVCLCRSFAVNATRCKWIRFDLNGYEHMDVCVCVCLWVGVRCHFQRKLKSNLNVKHRLMCWEFAWFLCEMVLIIRAVSQSKLFNFRWKTLKQSKSTNVFGIRRKAEHWKRFPLFRFPFDSFGGATCVELLTH